MPQNPVQWQLLTVCKYCNVSSRAPPRQIFSYQCCTHAKLRLHAAALCSLASCATVMKPTRTLTPNALLSMPHAVPGHELAERPPLPSCETLKRCLGICKSMYRSQPLRSLGRDNAPSVIT